MFCKDFAVQTTQAEQMVFCKDFVEILILSRANIFARIFEEILINFFLFRKKAVLSNEVYHAGWQPHVSEV